MAQMNLHENRAVDTQLSMPNRGGMSDQITKDQIFAKSELNAEIKNHSGESFLPSNISGNQFEQGSQFQRDQFKQDNLSNLHGEFEGDRLAGLSATNDVTARDHILAKKDLNAEIKGAAGFSDHVMPSAIAHKQGEHELHGEKLAGLSGTSDALMKDNILAKKEVNAEIEHAGSGFFGKRDIVPSSVNNSMGETIKEKISDAATAMKGTFKQSEQFPDRQLHGEQLAGLSGNNDALMQDNILAKKEVNAEIEHAGTGFFGKADRVVPSAIHSSLTETIKEKANNAAAAMKDTFRQEQRPYDRQLQGEQLAGLAGTNDALMQENIFAKKEVTAEIEKAGTGFFGKSDIMPSAVAYKSSEQFPREHLPGEQLAGLSATNDALMQENIFAKKGVNAEIEKAGAGLFGKHDIMPSAINHSLGETIKEKVSNAATAVKEKWQGEQFARDRLPGEQLAGLSGTSDSLVQENILAKKEVNAEIQHAGAGLFGKHDIMPSSISHKESQFPRERLPGEQLAGLSATNDALIQDNILAKKEVNAEIEHAGSGFFGKRDIMPSSIHKQSDHLPREYVPGEQLAGLSGTSDALMQENILAKKEVNAEIQHAGAGFFGKHDILPSSIHKESDHAPRERPPAEQLAGLIGTSDSMMKENILAKKEVNAEIQHAGAGLFGKHDIMPSSISHKESQIPRDHPHGEQLAGLSGTGDALMQDNILAKKEVNAEIEHAGTGFFGKADRVMPSAIHSSMTETIKDKVSSAANALKDTWQGSSKQELPHLQGEQLAGLSGTGDSLVQENILAKKEVNAEIEHAGTGFFGKRDQILPSDLSSKDAGLEEQHLSFAAMLKEKVTNAAIAVKETLQSYKQGEQFPHDHQLHGEELAGLSGSNDALMQENILAKKEVNAEIEHAGSGFFGKHDIVPSTVHGSMTETIKEKVSNAATAVKDRWQGEQLSNDRLPGEQLAGLSGTSDILMQDNILAKKEVNAEIEHAATGFFGKTDHIVPSAIHSKDAVVNKDLKGERLAGLGSTKDDVVKEHILAKEELNAQIKEHSTNTDQILPSDISSAAPTAGITVIHDGRSEVNIGAGLEEHPQSIGEMIKSRVTNAATVVKETLSNLH
jgi:ribosomal protein S24E